MAPELLHPALLDRVTIVLVRARNPSNIGAVARAMHDFGFRHLRVVNDYAVPFNEARAAAFVSAVDASSVLTAAVAFPTVAEAVADCTLVIGTTAVGARAIEHPLHPLADAAAAMRLHLAGNNTRIALLFGSEKTGLSNQEFSHCHSLLTIPMHAQASGRHLSMNLGQAVAVCLYELVRATAPPSALPASPPAESPATPATAAELEHLITLLDQLLDQIEYRRHHPANSDPATLRRLLHRLNLSAADSPIALSLIRQILWKLNRNKEP